MKSLNSFYFLSLVLLCASCSINTRSSYTYSKSTVTSYVNAAGDTIREFEVHTTRSGSAARPLQGAALAHKLLKEVEQELDTLPKSIKAMQE